MDSNEGKSKNLSWNSELVLAVFSKPASRMSKRDTLTPKELAEKLGLEI